MNKLKITVLSLSLLTVMAGAAVAPALGTIGSYFNSVNPLIIKLIITLPALMIILTSFFFGPLSRKLSSKKIALIGLMLYIIGGCGAGFANNIYVLLAFRVFLGIGVGMMMPLSTGLIAYFFNKDEQSKMMGFSSAMNNLGGIIATALSGLLVSLNWRASFLIYLMGFFVFILVVLYLPSSSVSQAHHKTDKKMIKKIAPFLFAIFLTMVIFYALPSNFAIIVNQEGVIPTSLVGLIMSVQNICAFITGLTFTKLTSRFGKFSPYFAAIVLSLGFFSLSFSEALLPLLVGLFLVGIGLGTLVPIINSQIPYFVEKENITSAMALVSAALYSGQFLSPFILDFLKNLFNINNLYAPYYLASLLGVVLLVSLIPTPFVISNSKHISKETVSDQD
ncbi:MFS transporter [Eubacteriaceae bacterium ES3]|nr:MFS transporter [Eubacteriaceae bacterium ES3]